MPSTADLLLDRLVTVFEGHRDTPRATRMAAYMRNLFPFLGIPTPARRALDREVRRGLPAPTEAELGEVALACWALPEREYQYFAVDLVCRHIRVCSPAFLGTLERLITTRSWWDTVDGLASHAAGGLVQAHPELREDMDRWSEAGDFWLARTAILYQLGYKQRTDEPRLFRYCTRNAGSGEVFLRKAIGWALREYSKTDPAAVREYVAAHAGTLSGLSRREALKWLDRRGAVAERSLSEVAEWGPAEDWSDWADAAR